MNSPEINFSLLNRALVYAHSEGLRNEQGAVRSFLSHPAEKPFTHHTNWNGRQLLRAIDVTPEAVYVALNKGRDRVIARGTFRASVKIAIRFGRDGTIREVARSIIECGPGKGKRKRIRDPETIWKKEQELIALLIRHNPNDFLYNKIFAQGKFASWKCEGVQKIVVYSELCEEGDLLNFLQNHPSDPKKPDYAQKNAFTRQLVDQVRVIHDTGVAHRDLKPENVLVKKSPSNDLILIITDFELSCVVSELPPEERIPISGTAEYFAPEMERLTPKIVKRTDIWYFAIILYIIWTEAMPYWADPSFLSLKRRAGDALGDVILRFLNTATPETIPDWLNNPRRHKIPLLPPIVKLLCFMFELDPFKRPTIEEVQKMLESEPLPFPVKEKGTRPTDGKDEKKE